MTDVITDRISGVTAALAFKTPCVAIATTPITLAGLQSVGGVVVDEDDRVIVNGQADTTENGIYDVSTGAWTRALDFDGARDVVAGTLVSVYGAADQTDMYEVRGTDPILIGTSAIAFALRYGANTRYDRTPDEITAGVTPTNYSYSGASRFTGNVKRYGCVCDGTTDDTAAFQRAVDSVGSKGGYLFVPGDMKLTSQILIRLKTGLTIELEQFAQITFTDGAYVGFLFSGGGGHILRGGRIYGSNHGATPLITLVQFGEASSPNQCPNALVEGVTFSYASKCVYLASTYETTCRNNLYANSDQAIVAGGLGSCTDIQLIGETFGNCTLGTNYVVQISSNGTRITDCYWETTTNTKGCLIIKTGAQYATITGGIAVTSGEFKVEPSNNVAVAGLSMQDCYDSVNLRTWRVDGSSNVKFSGCQLGFAAVVSNVTGILASGSVRVTGCDFIKCFNGVQLGPDSTVLGNGFLSCTTGVTVLSSMRVAENTFSSCGTGINVGSSLAAIGKNYYDTCGTNITDGTAGAAQVNEATKGTGTNVTDGATVAHTHPKTPRRVFAQGTVAGEFVSVTAIGASTFTVAIKKHDGTAGTSQTIYWETSG